MSAVPPQPPFGGANRVGYATLPQDERNGLAVGALVLGILGLAFPPLGLVGLIQGIVALVRANALISHKGRRLAIVGICCGGASLLLLPVMLDRLIRPCVTTMRDVCASNLKGIGQGMMVYANDNSDWYAVAPYTETPPVAGNAHAVTFIGQMANNLMLPDNPAQQSTVHPSRSLFLLIIDGSCTPKQFICPSSGDAEDDLRNRIGTTEIAAQPGVTRFDFRGYTYLSYGYQLPFGPNARPHWNRDSRLAIMADKGPFFAAGSGATGYESWTVRDAIPQGGGIPQAGDEISIGLTAAPEILGADNTKWRPYNSPNHSQEGENVLYQDGHVEFHKKPIAGVNYDNIYTMQSGYALVNSLLGQVPADLKGPLTQSDSVIVP